ncbi:MAG TPA: hypothetical protein VER36_06770 [Flavisolibacter sp.]|nr:hypothetical protein [Flavisolibacter sp.]
MKSLLLLSLVLAYVFTAAQNSLPSYHQVLKQYFEHYNHVPKEQVDGLNFAKKKNGWFVQVVNRLTEQVKEEQLFWSEGKGWQTLNGFDTAVSAAGQEEKVIEFLHGTANVYKFYGYARSPYYGYDGWDKEMINDFSHQPFDALADSVLENLGRAYSAYATRFSWYQFGGAISERDSLKRKLAPLEYPSRQRADSTACNIRKAIACYAALHSRNPNYRTAVGNIGMKHFNEQVFGYDQMMMAGYDDKAQLFIANIAPNQTIIRLAKNYLSNCPPNAILFSFGDLDTYTLWYVQVVLDFRKDVAVINQSLLGLPPYVNMLRRKKIVSFSAPPEVYGNTLFLYSLFREEGKKGIKQLSFSSFLQNLYNRKNHLPAEPATYQVKDLKLLTTKVKLKPFAGSYSLGNSILFQLGDYLTLDQMLMLDIIHTNIYQRPLCFTYPWELCRQYLSQKGMVYQLLPVDEKKASANNVSSIRHIESFLATNFQLVASSDLSTGIAPALDYDQTNYNLIGQLVEWYSNKGQKEKATQWLNKLKEVYHNELPSSNNAYLGYLHFITGDTKTGQAIFEQTAELVYQWYQHPSPLYPIMSKASAKLTISKLQTELEYLKLKSPIIEKIIAALTE